jgi:hypothetical protein
VLNLQAGAVCWLVCGYLQGTIHPRTACSVLHLQHRRGEQQLRALVVPVETDSDCCRACELLQAHHRLQGAVLPHAQQASSMRQMGTRAGVRKGEGGEGGGGTHCWYSCPILECRS